MHTGCDGSLDLGQGGLEVPLNCSVYQRADVRKRLHVLCLRRFVPRHHLHHSVNLGGDEATKGGGGRVRRAQPRTEAVHERRLHGQLGERYSSEAVHLHAQKHRLAPAKGCCEQGRESDVAEGAAQETLFAGRQRQLQNQRLERVCDDEGVCRGVEDHRAGSAEAREEVHRLAPRVLQSCCVPSACAKVSVVFCAGHHGVQVVRPLTHPGERMNRVRVAGLEA